MENVDIRKGPHIIMGLPPNLPENIEKNEVKSYRGKLILGGIIFVLIIIPMLAFIFLPKNVIQASKEIIMAPFAVDNGEERSVRWRATNSANPTAAPITAATQKKLSDSEVLALADNKYADGNVPLGDSQYVTDQPEKGYVFLCSSHTNSNAGGAQSVGNWISGSTWNYKKKISVQGSISWPDALFSNVVSGDTRTLSGNDLPINHTTGSFPIASTDPAYTYDKNPNKIIPQSFSEEVSAKPVYSDNPYCMTGEVGVMLSGVALFNGFDAGLRDAPAREIQDSCGGHPQEKGEYHYHSLSGCFKDISVRTVLGYALDGFPITGPHVTTDKYLTTEDLDECHGITSDILINGKMVTTYHYVMTYDFPYSVSCFRSVPSLASGQQDQPKPKQWSQVEYSQPTQTQQTSTEQSTKQEEQPVVHEEPQPQEEETSESYFWSIFFPQAAQTTREESYTSASYQSTVPPPPKEAIIACEGKAVNDLCSYKFKGKTFEGDCEFDANYFYTCVSGE